MQKAVDSSGPIEPQSESHNSDLLHLLVETVKDYAIVLMDTEGRILTWSPAAERLKGWTADEIIGQSFTRFYTGEDLQKGKPKMELRDSSTRRTI